MDSDFFYKIRCSFQHFDILQAKVFPGFAVVNRHSLNALLGVGLKNLDFPKGYLLAFRLKAGLTHSNKTVPAQNRFSCSGPEQPNLGGLGGLILLLQNRPFHKTLGNQDFL